MQPPFWDSKTLHSHETLYYTNYSEPNPYRLGRTEDGTVP